MSEETSKYTKYSKYLKIGGVVLVIAAVIGITYYTFFYRTQTKVCPQNRTYSDKYNKCILDCGNSKHYFVDPSGTEYCVDNCSSGFVNDPKPPYECIKYPADCGQTSVNSETGGIIGELQSRDKYRCINIDQITPQDRNYYQPILDNICKQNVCQCDDPNTCKYPECQNKQNFKGFSFSENSCVVPRDCSKEKSVFANIFPEIDKICPLVKKQDPTDPNSCIELTLEDIQDKCLNDNNGCLYGYSYDPNNKICIDQNGNKMPAGNPGCRPTNQNNSFNGLTCANQTVEYNIVVDISTATTTTIIGQYSFTTPPQPQYEVTHLRYVIFEADSCGNILTNSPSQCGGLISDNIVRSFDLTKYSPAQTCNIKTLQNCVDFTIDLTGQAYDRPLVLGGYYRMLICIYGIVNSEEKMLYCSKSAVDSNGKVNVLKMGDILVPTSDDEPTGLKLSLLPELDRNSADNYASNSGYNVINQIYNNKTINGSSNVIQPSSPDNYPPVPQIDTNLFPYSLCVCTSQYCREDVDKMIIVLSWKKVVPTQTFYNDQVVRYYLRREAVDGLGGKIELINSQLGNDTLSESDTNGYFADILGVGTTFIYTLACYVSDKNDTNPYYQKYPNSSSAFRTITVDVPIYTKELCKGIPDSTGIPPFYLLNPQSGVCDRPGTMQKISQQAKDWWCALGEGNPNPSAQNPTGFDPQKIGDNLYIWTDNGCSKLFPNKYPTVINDEKDILTSNFSEGDIQWLQGKNVQQTAMAGCVGQFRPTSENNYSPLIQQEKVPNPIYLQDVTDRLTGIDQFGDSFIPNYKINSDAINTLSGNLFPSSAKLVNNPSWGTNPSNCAPDDQQCLNIAQLSNCTSNYCPQWAGDGSGNPLSYSRTLKYIPTTTQGSVGPASVACNGNGTFSVTNPGTQNLQGNCSCNNDGNTYDQQCKLKKNPWDVLPNCEVIDPNNSNKCLKCIWNIEKCGNNPSDPNNCKPLRPDNAQPFVNKDGVCVINRNPYVWNAIVSGYSAHHPNGDWGYNPDPSNNTMPNSLNGTCRNNETNVLRLSIPARDDTEPNSVGSLDYNSCGLLQPDIINKKKSSQVLERNMIYDFTTTPPTSLDKPVKIDFDFKKLNTDPSKCNGTDCVVDMISGPFIFHQDYGQNTFVMNDPSQTDGFSQNVWNRPETREQAPTQVPSGAPNPNDLGIFNSTNWLFQPDRSPEFNNIFSYNSNNLPIGFNNLPSSLYRLQ